MSRLKKEIIATKTVVNVSEAKRNHPQRLAEDVLEQVAGGWVNAFARWGRAF